ncbi:hypothetical protein GMOD_00000449 [Pyrenophora seminiperda CCB06]|uniref:Uncharacterized protein n=1 Tax=Pyrenophora seminiperda CCB06 TaxID=1302712 RepID=A0A3M7M778_9PLEO|nr:hypothetical protein GMOD_00000449 [Pyrenophora seminiperda CCB06]
MVSYTCGHVQVYLQGCPESLRLCHLWTTQVDVPKILHHRSTQTPSTAAVYHMARIGRQESETVWHARDPEPRPHTHCYCNLAGPVYRMAIEKHATISCLSKAHA